MTYPICRKGAALKGATKLFAVVGGHHDEHRETFPGFVKFEADIRQEQQQEGIEREKAVGRLTGRKPSIDTEAIHALHRQGIGATDIAR